MSEHAIETIEMTLKHAKGLVDTKKAVQRLMSNRDFKRIVLDGYFEKEAIRLVMLKSFPHLQDAESQASILRDMDSIGSFQQYLNNQIRMGDEAEKSIEEHETALEELRAEV